MRHRLGSLFPLLAVAFVALHCGGDDEAASAGPASGSTSGATTTGASSSGTGEGGATTASSSGAGGAGGAGTTTSASGTGAGGDGSGGSPLPEEAFSALIPGQENEEVASVAASPDGSFWLAGQATMVNGPAGVASDFDMGGGVVVKGAFLARLAPDGAPLVGVTLANVGTNGLDLEVIADAEGNAILAGRLSTSATIGGTTITSAGSIDGFVAKLDPTGTVVFARALGSAAPESDVDIAVDASGNIVAAILLAGSADFGGGAIGGAGSIAVVRYAPDGAFLGAHVAPTSGVPAFIDLAVDAGSNAIVAYGATGATPGYVVALGPAGDTIFATQIDVIAGGGGAPALPLRAVGVTPGGDIVVAGQLAGTIDVAGSQVSSAFLDGIVIRLDPAGLVVAAKTFGAAGSVAQPHELRVATNGDVIVAGKGQGTLDFGAGPVPVGTSFWLRWTASFDYVQAITGSPIGIFHVAARSESTLVGASIDTPVDLGNGALTPVTSLDVAVARVLAP